MNVWPLISIALSAVFWAAASILLFRYRQSKFYPKNGIETIGHDNFWNPVYSSQHAKQIFGFKVDAFHIFQSTAIILFSMPAAKAMDWHPTHLKFWFIDVDFLICLAIVGAVWNIVFPNSYGKLWARKQKPLTDYETPNH